MTLNKNSSTGNKGASNNHQQSTINNHQQSTTNHQQSTEAKKAIETLERDLAISFKMLTDREFSVFMAISELSGQHGETTYTQVANILNLTETSIRGAVNRIISKNLPVNKERIFNGKTSLFLRKDFKELNLLNKLIRLRQHPTDQKTLF